MRSEKLIIMFSLVIKVVLAQLFNLASAQEEVRVTIPQGTLVGNRTQVTIKLIKLDYKLTK